MQLIAKLIGSAAVLAVFTLASPAAIGVVIGSGMFGFGLALSLNQ